MAQDRLLGLGSGDSAHRTLAQTHELITSASSILRAFLLLGLRRPACLQVSVRLARHGRFGLRPRLTRSLAAIDVRDERVFLFRTALALAGLRFLACHAKDPLIGMLTLDCYR